MGEITHLIIELAEKVYNGVLTADELRRNIFTLTNLGKSCMYYFTPILNFSAPIPSGIGGLPGGSLQSTM
jgi:pyruvate/2-oxoglutarate dehydrogenase complex dihydrolipoamide acyltransferase (E2) component